MMRRLSRITVNADTIWDILGALSIAALLIGGIWIGHGLGLTTGGDDLLRVAP